MRLCDYTSLAVEDTILKAKGRGADLFVPKDGNVNQYVFIASLGRSMGRSWKVYSRQVLFVFNLIIISIYLYIMHIHLFSQFIYLFSLWNASKRLKSKHPTWIHSIFLWKTQLYQEYICYHRDNCNICASIQEIHSRTCFWMEAKAWSWHITNCREWGSCDAEERLAYDAIGLFF